MNKVHSLYWRLVFIVVIYFIVGTLYAIYTPAWQVPDEPAHYNYIRALATTGRLPVIEMGDYDQDYQARLVFEEKFSPELSIEPLQYEDWQPPLYYLLAAPLFVLAGGSLLALRLFSVLLGAGVLVFAFLISREAFPSQPAIALGTAAFVAFVPQHVAMMAGVNNDSLAELLLAALMWCVFRCNLRLPAYSVFHASDSGGQQPAIGHQDSKWNWLLLGVLLGLGLITKLSFYIAVPLVAWAFIRYAMRNLALSRVEGTQYAIRITFHVLLITLPALILALPWWLRNIAVYGWPDFMGLARHNAVVEGQPTSAWWIEQYGWGDLLGRFFKFTFQSFWGQFGWMAVPMAPRYYLALGALSLLALVGFAWALALRSQQAGLLAQHPAGSASTPWARPAATPTANEAALQQSPLRLQFPRSAVASANGVLWRDARFQLLGAWVTLTALMYLYYNLTFVQHQGRYLFPALIPIGLAFIIGLRQWIFLSPPPLRNAMLALPYLGLVGLDLWALFCIIIPSLR